MSAKRSDPGGSQRWEFKARFRRGAFGWKSQPAIQRIKQALSEIKKVARRDPLLAAEGAVLFLERVSPAIQRVDSSSGSITTAVNRAIEQLVPIIAAAPADAPTRAAWLERLWNAHAEDEIAYIDTLADYWGDLCGSKEVASTWADNLIGITRMALSPDKSLGGFFHGTPACLSALYRAGRFEELIDLLQGEAYWPYARFAAMALAALGQTSAAIARAESSQDGWDGEHGIGTFCEELLLSSGAIEEAYERYGLQVSRGGTHLATFRALVKKYPHKRPEQILADLVKARPCEEGKWFTSAKELGLYEAAIELARSSPCDPKTLARAARDYVAKQPAFALEVGIIALAWVAEGYGYEITSLDVRMAFSAALQAAEALGRLAETRERIQALAKERPNFVRDVLGRELGLS